jgi:hypothetical protein
MLPKCYSCIVSEPEPLKMLGTFGGQLICSNMDHTVRILE